MARNAKKFELFLIMIILILLFAVLFVVLKSPGIRHKDIELTADRYNVCFPNGRGGKGEAWATDPEMVAQISAILDGKYSFVEKADSLPSDYLYEVTPVYTDASKKRADKYSSKTYKMQVEKKPAIRGETIYVLNNNTIALWNERSFWIGEKETDIDLTVLNKLQEPLKAEDGSEIANPELTPSYANRNDKGREGTGEDTKKDENNKLSEDEKKEAENPNIDYD